MFVSFLRSHVRRVLALVPLVALLPTGLGAAQVDYDAQIKSAMAAYMKATKTPGVAVGYVIEKDGAYVRGVDTAGTAGYSGSHIAVTSQTVFQIGSVTKGFTATLLALAIQRGKATLKTPVLPSLKAYGAKGSRTFAKITFGDLATQSAGLPNNGVKGSPSIQLFADEAPSASELNFWNTYESPQDQQPGTCWLYSNSGFVTLGFGTIQLFDAPEKGSYSKIFAKEIAAPLGLTCTGPAMPSGCPIAKGTIVRASSLKNATDIAPDLKSNADDMVKFLQANIAGVPGNAELSSAIALTQKIVPIGVCGKKKTMQSGLAYQVNSISGSTNDLYDKDGALGASGMSDAIAFSPDHHIGVVVLTNAIGGHLTDNGSNEGPGVPQGLANAIVRTMLGVKQ